MTHDTTTASDLARATTAHSTASDLAHSAAAALDEALFGGGSATAMLLDGAWYVTTTGTGEGVDFAYDAKDIGEIDADTWDYSAWCAGVSPLSDVTVAVAYYLATGSLLGEAGAASAILSDEQTATLDIVRRLDL